MEIQTCEISPDGDVVITVRGVRGKACKDATAQIEKALGKVTSDTPTGEMHVNAKASH